MEEFSLLLQSHSEEKARQLLQERYSLSGSQKPFLILHEGAGDISPLVHTKRRKRRNKSIFSRQLAEFIAKGDRKFQSYLQLQELWNAYITNVLGSSRGLPASQTLLSADWHGARITVTSAKNPTMVGISGILLWESRSQWLVVTEDNVFKMIPKRGSIINITCPKEERYAVVGDRVLCRSSERTTRKFKPHDVGYIVPLLTRDLLSPAVTR